MNTTQTPKAFHHTVINPFRNHPVDRGRERKTEIALYPCGGDFAEFFICELFDEALQSHVSVKVHRNKILDFVERRQPLNLRPAEIKAVQWTKSGSTSYAKSWSTWNEKRGTWELCRVGVGPQGLDVVLRVFEEQGNF